MHKRTLAHLSDLHLGRSEGTRRTAERLCAELERVDHVVVTGDVTHRGRSTEWAMFLDVFAPLLEAGRMTIVPGNHDRLGDDVAESIMGPRRVDVVYRPGLYLVRVDSTAWHNRYLVAGHGALCEGVIAECEAALADAPEGSLRAVLLHHHVLPAPVETFPEKLAELVALPFAGELALGGRLLERLSGLAELVLHGHRHTPRAVEWSGLGATLGVYNAGSSTESVQRASSSTLRAGSSPPRTGSTRRFVMKLLSLIFLGTSMVGLALFIIQLGALIAHRRRRSRAPEHRPPISILRPLCGHDDDLATLLDELAALDYPEYEVLLGVRDMQDAAYLVAVEAARRHAHVRVVLQRGEPGHNPKVNQLITLARAARHDLLVVSDANVRVPADYLDEIALHLSDPHVGMVTHPVVGDGARRLGAILDNLHMTSSIGPGMVGAQRVSGKDFVVGKSMAMWRHDLLRMGGFEAVRDVLAEDYVLGRKVATIGKRVVMAATPVVNVVRERSVRGFLDRYGRWAVLHRQGVGLPVFCAQLLLNPSLFAVLALAASPTAFTLVALANVVALRALVDGGAGLALDRTFSFYELCCTPLRDACLAIAWTRGISTDEVKWRGNTLRVGPGTRLVAQHIASERGLRRAA